MKPWVSRQRIGKIWHCDTEIWNDWSNSIFSCNSDHTWVNRSISKYNNLVARQCASGWINKIKLLSLFDGKHLNRVLSIHFEYLNSSPKQKLEIIKTPRWAAKKTAQIWENLSTLKTFTFCNRLALTTKWVRTFHIIPLCLYAEDSINLFINLQWSR